MSQSIRRNNLFAAEDWKTIYTKFLSNVNFVSYDYDTLRQSLIEYIKNHYPENFNDWIKSSEFIAIIDLLAWLGENLSFRVDLNTRENFLDTAERRESILQLAGFLSYKPKRNINAKGFLKIVGIQTNDDVFDNNGQNLNGVRIDFNDPKNPDWYEQFIIILNNAFDSNTQFGYPLEQGNDADNVNVEVYRIDKAFDGTFNHFGFSTVVNGINVDFEVVDVGFDGLTYYEREPDLYGNFHILYKNDSTGFQSPNTGFFVYFKQGTLNFSDYNITNAIENRVIDIDVPNINNDDVFVHSITEDSQIIQVWKKTPQNVFSNIVFNNIPINDKYIFSVDTRLNDQISVVFGDGRFAASPFGLLRIYYRTSINDYLIIKPTDIQNISITIPYVNKEGLTKNLILYLSLQETVSNSAPSESNEEIKTNASRVYYTQNRMVNAEDYYNFVLQHPAVLKVKALNRTYAGHSRYIDINDPTGEHRSVKIFGNDGILYEESSSRRIEIPNFSSINEDTIITSYILPAIKTNEFRDFLLIALFENSKICSAYSTMYTNPPGSTGLMWDLISIIGDNATGRFVDASEPIPVSSSAFAFEIGNSVVASNYAHLMKEGSYVKFDKDGWVNIIRIEDDGKGLTNGFDDNGNGKVILSKLVKEGNIVLDVIPPLRTDFSSQEIENIKEKLSNKEIFAIYYDPKIDSWEILDPPDGGFDENSIFDYCDDARKWMILINPDISSDRMEILIRKKRYIFESEKDVRFFFINKNTGILDEKTGKIKRDTIKLFSTNLHPLIANANNIETWVSGKSYQKDEIVLYNKSYYIALSAHTSDDFENDPWLNICPNLTKEVSFVIEDNYMYDDGHIEPRKSLVSYETDNYGFIEDPESFNLVLKGIDIIKEPKYLVWEKYVDYDGYEYTRPFEITRIFEDNTYASALATMDDFYINLDTRPLWQHGDTILVIGNDNYNIFRFDIYNVYTDTDVKPAGFDTGDIKIPSQQEILNKNDFILKMGRNKLLFGWEHVAPIDWRTDPSVSNIIDIFVLTTSYDEQIRNWVKTGDSTNKPSEPSQTELNLTFKEFNSLKMISDEIIWHPVKYKILFGKNAPEELQATVEVIKSRNSTKSEGEIKASIVNLVDEFFAPENWDFGETFYLSELISYIHQKLIFDIESVILRPKNNSSIINFLEIKAEPDELFISSLTVDDIDIIDSFSNLN